MEGSAGDFGPLGGALAVALALLISFATPYLIGPRMRRLAREEVPAGVRPRRQWALSGLSITVACTLPLLVFGAGAPGVRAAVLVALLAGLAGMANDVLSLPRLAQFGLAFAIAWIAVSQGIVIDEVKLPFTTRMLDLGVWSYVASILWLLAVAYATVICRRLPRLTPRLIAIISTTFAAAALLVGPSRSAPSAALLGLVLAGAAAGAARRDYPALGSAAHWTMGFLLGSITILGMLKNTAFLVLGVPLLALGVPLGETTYAIVYGAGKGGARLALSQRRELLHDALIRIGVSPARTVLLLQTATLYLCTVALALVLVVTVTFLAKLAILAAALALGFVVFFMVTRIAAEPRKTAGERLDMFGVPLVAIDMAGALDKIDQFVAERSPRMVVTSDSPGVIRAQDDPEYQEAVRAADMVTADGRGVVWMARVLGLPVTERVSGVDLVQKICERAGERGYAVYLLGAKPGVAEDAASALTSKCPGLKVVGTQHGYFTPLEEPAVIDAITRAKPDILLVAFGVPLQEKWIRRHLSQAGVPVAIGVGGAFDVLSGRKHRAPKWMQNAGLEWVYRAACEPSRILRLWALPRLMWMTLREALRRRRD